MPFGVHYCCEGVSCKSTCTSCNGGGTVLKLWWLRHFPLCFIVSSILLNSQTALFTLSWAVGRSLELNVHPNTEDLGFPFGGGSPFCVGRVYYQTLFLAWDLSSDSSLSPDTDTEPKRRWGVSADAPIMCLPLQILMSGWTLAHELPSVFNSTMLNRLQVVVKSDIFHYF